MNYPRAIIQGYTTSTISPGKRPSSFTPASARLRRALADHDSLFIMDRQRALRRYRWDVAARTERACFARRAVGKDIENVLHISRFNKAQQERHL